MDVTTESLSLRIVVGRLDLKLNVKHPSIFIYPPTQMQLHLIPLCVYFQLFMRQTVPLFIWPDNLWKIGGWVCARTCLSLFIWMM